MLNFAGFQSVGEQFLPLLVYINYRRGVHFSKVMSINIMCVVGTPAIEWSPNVWISRVEPRYFELSGKTENRQRLMLT